MGDDVTTKRCNRCGDDKPVAAFGKDRCSSDLLKGTCRACLSEKMRLYRAANPEKVREQRLKAYAANSEKYRELGRKRYAANPAMARERTHKWRVANLEKARERNRVAAQKAYTANPEKYRERHRRWAEANPDKVRENMQRWQKANPDKCREHGRRWEVANPDVCRARGARRRAIKKLAADPSACAEAIQHVYQEAEACELLLGIPFGVDHVVPISRSGKHHEDNLRVLPARLNYIKCAKLDTEVTSPEFHAHFNGGSAPDSFEQVTVRTFHIPRPLRDKQHNILTQGTQQCPES